MAKNSRNLRSPISAGEVQCFLDPVQVLESEIMFQNRMVFLIERAYIEIFAVQILVDCLFAMAESMFFAHQIQLSAEAILVMENPDFRRMNYHFHPCSVQEKSDGKQTYHHIISDHVYINIFIH